MFSPRIQQVPGASGSSSSDDDLTPRPSRSNAFDGAGLPQRSGAATQQRPRQALGPTTASGTPFDDPVLQSLADALARSDAHHVFNLVAQARTRQVGFGTPDTMRLIDLALRLRSPGDICVTLTHLPHFDLNAPIEPHGRTLLAVAAELNAHDFARWLMRKGARLDALPPQADKDMQNWFTAVTEVDKLYPNGAPPNATLLDRALMQHDFVGATTLLERVRQGRTDREMWEHSVGTEDKPDREDIRRGMLIVGDRHARTADSMAAVMHKVGFKTSSKPTMDLLKTLLYYSPERRIESAVDGVPVNMNWEVRFDGVGQETGKLIGCGELASVWIDGLDARGKFDYAAFQTEQDVQRNVPLCVADEARMRLSLSPRVNQTPVEHWGQRLADEFRDMESRDQRLRPLLLSTSNHFMAAALIIKNKVEDGGQTKYVVKTFDPNVSLGHKRVASLGDLRPIEALHFKDVTHTHESCESYFMEDGQSTVLSFDSPPPGWKQHLPRKAVSDRGRRLAEPWTGPIDGPVLRRLFLDGFEGELRDLEPRIRAKFASLPRDAGLQLLLGRGGDGLCGVHSILKEGHAHTLKWYCEFLVTLNLSQAERKWLIGQEGIDGTTAADGPFSTATASPSRNVQSVRAYFQHALPLLSPMDALDVLNSRLPDGCPVIFSAMSGSNEVALDLYCDAARRFGMPVQMKRAILTDGELGLPHVYHYARPEPFLRQAYDELVVGLGMQDDPDVKDARLNLYDQAMAHPDVQQPRLQRADALATAVLQAGTAQDQARRRNLEAMLSQRLHATGVAASLGPCIGICQIDNDIVMVPAQRADKAFLKYDRAPQKQDLLQQALVAFSDPLTKMYELGDDGYAYKLKNSGHGPCRVEFSFARNAVTELRVLDGDGDTLAVMRPTIDRVLRH
jgi:hypothetical protein